MKDPTVWTVWTWNGKKWCRLLTGNVKALGAAVCSTDTPGLFCYVRGNGKPVKGCPTLEVIHGKGKPILSWSMITGSVSS